MTPDLLRNAWNAQQHLQVRLELSLTECRQLQDWLVAARRAGAVCDADRPALQQVLAKLSRAAEQAVRLIQCPVCHEWFAQGRQGRSAQYCTPACKQKAYRQRQQARQRQPPTAAQGH